MDATHAMDAPTKPLHTVREPRVYLVGRQVIDESGVQAFLADHGLTWKTDTTAGGEQLAELAGRVCYMSYGKGRRTNREFLEHIVEVGHGSVLEHAVWSFLITGVSRSLTHELIRHRHFSYSQLSQRYVDESDSDFVAPDPIADDPELSAAWEQAVNATRAAYDALVQGLQKKFTDVPEATLRRKLARQAARSVLPNATESDPSLRRAARQRARRRRDPQGRGGDARARAPRGAGHVLGLRAGHAGRRHAGDAHESPQGLRPPAAARRSEGR
jgi:thymidylate synthase (FAD)